MGIDGREKFFNYAYGTRTAMSKMRAEGKEVNQEKMLLMSLTHTPVLVTNGDAGLNASVKGFGFCPKPEYLQEMYDLYMSHLKTYNPTAGADNSAYFKRAHEILYESKYAPQNVDKVDRTKLISIEMAKDYNVQHKRDTVAHTYINTVNKGAVDATVIFYSPATITYESRGKLTLHGYHGMKEDEMDLYQKVINAQHDMNGRPFFDRWKRWPVYVFDINEVYENSIVGADGDGWGKQIF